jgi:hypothetical protein
MCLSRIFVYLFILITSSQVIANNNNPFNKTIVVTAGHGVSWQFGDQTATKSVRGADGTWYHLFYDGLRLRLRLTTSAEDAQTSARQFEAFAVYDVKIDGKRADVFQWCLNNQDRHDRFLQQGLSVKKGICQNIGEHGTFIMRLSQDTLNALNSGEKIDYELKPFRTTVRVEFGINDFEQANREFSRQRQARLVASQPKVEPPAMLAPAPAALAAMPKPKSRPKPKARCTLDPPAGFAEIDSIEYECNNVEQRIDAQATIDLKVERIYEQRSKAAAEAERKRLEAARQQAEEARLAEEKLKQEQAALAASAAVQAELSSDIAKKMIAVCQKNWAVGEHRCYCEKYIQFAPANIESNPGCK